MKEQFNAMSRTLALARDLIVDGQPEDAELARAFSETTVSLVADKRNLQSPAAQSALATLFSLVARLGCRIRLVIPDVPIVAPLHPVRGTRLREGLLDLGGDLVPGATVDDGPGPSNLTFLFGDTVWNGAGSAWRLTAGPWEGQVTSANVPGARIQGAFPLGAMTAAALAAAEPFKEALRRLAAQGRAGINTELTCPLSQVTLSLADPTTPTAFPDMGPVDLVSGGAITTAVLYVLLQVPGLRGTLRIIEPQVTELSNVNRYMLMRATDTGLSKVTLLARFGSAALSIQPIQRLFTSDFIRTVGPLVAQTMIGADDVSARWEVQRAYPGWLAVGSTSHFFTLTSSHERDQACAGCLHPHNEPGPELIPTAAFVSFWAGLLLAARLLRRILGCPHALGEQAVVFWPLLPDGAQAHSHYQVQARQDCPISCPASLHL